MESPIAASISSSVTPRSTEPRFLSMKRLVHWISAKRTMSSPPSMPRFFWQRRMFQPPIAYIHFGIVSTGFAGPPMYFCTISSISSHVIFHQPMGCQQAAAALDGTGKRLAHLAHGHHGRAATCQEHVLLHLGNGLDKEDPDRTPACVPKMQGSSSTATSKLSSAKLMAASSCSMRLLM